MADEVTARARHVEDVKRAMGAVQLAEEALASGALEMVAEHLKQAHHALASMVGVRDHEEVLARIFSEFCIGK
jgi:tRNA modification GTPase